MINFLATKSSVALRVQYQNGHCDGSADAGPEDVHIRVGRPAEMIFQPNSQQNPQNGEKERQS